jgi:hypothetical protein
MRAAAAAAATAAAAPSSGSEPSGLSRHVPGLRHLTSRLPAGALPRVHLRHAVSRANPFRAVRSLSRHAEDSGAAVQTVTYEVRCTRATHIMIQGSRNNTWRAACDRALCLLAP